MKKLFFLTILSFCFYACSSRDPHPELKALNKGFLYDPLEYKVNPGTEGCVEDCDTASHVGLYLWHRCKCAKWGYCPYYRLKYKDNSLSQMLSIKGEPTYHYRDTSYYGYKLDQFGNPYFCISDFYDPEYTEVEESQEFYRVSKLLNRPIDIVHTVVWIDQKTYLRMHFLEMAKDTLAFHGFQSLPDYELLWQY